MVGLAKLHCSVLNFSQGPLRAEFTLQLINKFRKSGPFARSVGGRAPRYQDTRPPHDQIDTRNHHPSSRGSALLGNGLP